MKRVTMTFMGLLGLATLAAGQLWTQVELLGAGRVTSSVVATILFSAALLGVTLVGLSRILYRTAARAPIPIPLKETTEWTE